MNWKVGGVLSVQERMAMKAKDFVLNKYPNAHVRESRGRTRLWFFIVNDDYKLLGKAPSSESTAWQNAKRNIQDKIL